MNTKNIIVIILLACALAYLIGRLFATGLMDGINHKFNKFTKFKNNDDKKEKAK